MVESAITMASPTAPSIGTIKPEGLYLLIRSRAVGIWAATSLNSAPVEGARTAMYAGPEVGKLERLTYSSPESDAAAQARVLNRFGDHALEPCCRLRPG
jgi:hypothetical protein